MRRILLAAVAAAAIAAPAHARDGSGYVGVDVGPMLLEDVEYEYHQPGLHIKNALDVDHKTGFDVGVFGGYDFGLFRVEGELAYKRASVDEIRFGPQIVSGAEDAFVDADGRHNAMSAMVNALVDLGDEDSWSGFLGGGVGVAKVKAKASFPADDDDFTFSDSDGGLAWQLLAGVRTALTPNIDLGLKYRFFNTTKFELNDSDTGAELRAKWRSHSLLASLTYNFYSPPPPVEAAPPPPPPPPPPPATQTCPDGSVILATETCPVPPPPPPPPPPAPERG